MGDGLDLGAATRLIDAAEVLRQDAGDVRWLVDEFARTFEELLPDRVEVTRTGLVRRHVRAFSIRLGHDYFECRTGAGGSLETLTAPVRHDIVGRRRPVPVADWVARLERTLEREVLRTGEDRDALNRLLP